MGTPDSLHNALENLNAMILAADLRDRTSVGRLAAYVEEILRSMRPALPETELLCQVLSVLNSVDTLEPESVVQVVAAAIAELSQETGDGESAKRLTSAANDLRRLLIAQEDSAAGRLGGMHVRPEASHEASSAMSNSPQMEPAVEVDAQLLAEFVAESNDRIALAEAATLVLEKDPHDAEAVNSVLRAFHTIKGASGLLGLSRIQQLAHHAESLLIRGRDGEIQMAGRHIDLALQSCDALKFMVEDIQDKPPGHVPALPTNYDALLVALAEHEQAAPNVSSPDRAIAAGRDAAVPATKPARRQVPDAASADAAFALGNEEHGEEPSTVSRPQGSASSAAAGEASVRVNTQRLDNLVNLVGELVIAQAIVSQDSRASEDNSARLARSVSAAGKITRELQDLAMSLRMVPLKGTFQKMARLVRDLAHKSDKTVHFHMSGEDTEIDRSMVEVLTDPLAHMIRNAVDHGIERAVDRAAQGKASEGNLHLRAYHAAGNVVIELEDDGRGLNRDRILHQAVQRGVIDPESSLSDDEANYLIFHPGLSTADIVTEISGRGVGLDVVKRNIESLRGRIEVATAPGDGTRFTLRMPLTTAIIDAMSVCVGRQQYLLPTVVIQRSFRPEPGAISTVAGQGEIVMLHGQVLPLFRLHRLFRIEGAQQDPQRALLVVIEGDGRRCAVMVDELLGQQQAVMKSLGNSLSNITGVTGGAILSDGRVGLILDAAGLVHLAHGGHDSVRPASATRLSRPQDASNRSISLPHPIG